MDGWMDGWETDRQINKKRCIWRRVYSLNTVQSHLHTQTVTWYITHTYTHTSSAVCGDFELQGFKWNTIGSFCSAAQPQTASWNSVIPALQREGKTKHTPSNTTNFKSPFNENITQVRSCHSNLMSFWLKSFLQYYIYPILAACLHLGLGSYVKICIM